MYVVGENFTDTVVVSPIDRVTDAGLDSENATFPLIVSFTVTDCVPEIFFIQNVAVLDAPISVFGNVA